MYTYIILCAFRIAMHIWLGGKVYMFDSQGLESKSYYCIFQRLYYLALKKKTMTFNP